MIQAMEFKTPPPQWSEKIEMFVSDSKAKSRLKEDLLPVELIYRKPKINWSLVDDIVEQFASEVSKKSHYFAKAPLYAVIKPFVKAAAQVLKLNPTKVSIQVTTAPSIYIFAEINHQNLHIDLNFSENTGKFEEAVVNVFSNKTQKLNVFGSLEEVTFEIQNYFEPRNTSYEYFIQSHYAIPGQTYTPYLF